MFFELFWFNHMLQVLPMIINQSFKKKCIFSVSFDLNQGDFLYKQFYSRTAEEGNLVCLLWREQLQDFSLWLSISSSILT